QGRAEPAGAFRAPDLAGRVEPLQEPVAGDREPVAPAGRAPCLAPVGRSQLHRNLPPASPARRTPLFSPRAPVPARRPTDRPRGAPPPCQQDDSHYWSVHVGSQTRMSPRIENAVSARYVRTPDMG